MKRRYSKKGFCLIILSSSIVLFCLVSGCVIFSSNTRNNSDGITTIPATPVSTLSQTPPIPPVKVCFWYTLRSRSIHVPFDEIYPGETLQFNASCSQDPGGNITSYSWDFGDNQTGTGITPQHAYNSTGHFSVYCKVISSNGETGELREDIKISSVRICC